MKRHSHHLLLSLAFVLLAVWLAPAEDMESDALTVLDALIYRDIVLFPVTGQLSNDGREFDFLLLDEGMASGEVIVQEVGGDESLRINVVPAIREETSAQGQNQIQTQSAGGARVNTVLIQNNSSRPLFLMAGEIIKGAKQDRIIGHDYIVPPKSKDIHIDVFCVEPQRWHSTSATFTSANAVAGVQVRKSAQAAKDQQDVWDNVAVYNETSGVISETGSLQAAYGSDRFLSQISEYRDNLVPRIEATIGINGVVVYTGNRFISADVFGSERLFKQLFEKLLTSYVLDALLDNGPDVSRVSVREPEKLLERLHSAETAVEYDDGDLVLERVTDGDRGGIRCFYAKQEVHLNVF